MMMTSTELSKYRQHLHQLVEVINKLAFQCAFADPLIQGTPGEVFRTCGQRNCQCASDRAHRHGPYLVLQVYQNKKQRQIALKQEEKVLWQQAKNYQKQIHTLAQLKKTCAQLTDVVREVIQKRVEEIGK